MSTGISPTYPVRVEGRLDPGLSRWLWLVKWLLVIPHYFVLAFLWIAFVLNSIAAFFAILFTGRYPRAIFDFNVGVLRWTWRVTFYAFGANGTDRYPPFMLEEADYPATFDVEYPQRLSRGLVLVKWWLLAIPHYLVLALFVGGGTWFASWAGGEDYAYGGGLIGLLVLIAVVVLLFSGRYPSGIFDLVLGMNRWALRVAAYAGLMTDRYPPFRLDMGGSEPGAIAFGPPPVHTAGRPRSWTGGRIVLVVLGSLAALVAAGVLAAGGVAVVADQTQRDGQGFLMSPAKTFSTGTYALVSERVRADVTGPDWGYSRDLLGSVKLRSESTNAVFVGIGPAAAVDRYLAGVPREEIRDLGDDTGAVLGGTSRPTAPQEQTFWVATTSGSGDRALRWDVQNGDWRAVVMNAGGTRGVSADLRIGARVPDLGWIGVAVLAGGVLLLSLGGVLIYLGARRPEGSV